VRCNFSSRRGVDHGNEVSRAIVHDLEEISQETEQVLGSDTAAMFKWFYNDWIDVYSAEFTVDCPLRHLSSLPSKRRVTAGDGGGSGKVVAASRIY
jgi:hypothetical protein